MAPDAADEPPRNVPPQHVNFTTTDADEAQDFIDRMYSAQPSRAGQHLGPGSPVALSQVSAGGLSHVDFTMPPDLTLHLDGTDDLSITTLVTGRTEAELGGDVERYAPGDSFLGSFPHGEYRVRCLRFRGQILTVPAAALAEVTGTLPGQPRPELRFASLRPASPAASRQWRRTASYARSLLQDSQAASSPLVLAGAGRLLAATALTVFPNTVFPIDAAPESAAGDRLDAHPSTLRRAVAFIDEHPDLDISAADIARAACATPRAVQLAFRRHLATTPLAYLRRVRLEQAHRELRDAVPGSGTTVGAVAAHWGFTASRFTEHYRTAFGVLPSLTLRT